MIVTRSAIRNEVETCFNFNVYMGRLTGPDNIKTPLFGLFRDDRTEDACVCDRSVMAGYEPHTVDDVAAMTEAAASGFPGADLSVACSFRNGAHHVVVGPTKEQRRAIATERDGIWPRFVLRAGYGGQSFRASLGLYRDACRNLQMVRSAGGFITESIHHTRILRNRMPELIEQFRELSAGWDDLTATVAAMQQREVDLAAFIAEVYPRDDVDSETVRTRNIRDRRTEMIVRRIMNERRRLGIVSDAIGRATAWEAWNGVQGYIQWDQRRNGNPDPLDRALIAMDDASTTRAWNLATCA